MSIFVRRRTLRVKPVQGQAGGGRGQGDLLKITYLTRSLSALLRRRSVSRVCGVAGFGMVLVVPATVLVLGWVVKL